MGVVVSRGACSGGGKGVDGGIALRFADGGNCTPVWKSPPEPPL